jgi:hypothetical protein
MPAVLDSSKESQSAAGLTAKDGLETLPRCLGRKKTVSCDETSDSRRLRYHVAMYWRIYGVLGENGDATACPCDGRGRRQKLNDRPTSDGPGGERRDADGHGRTTRGGVAESSRVGSGQVRW